MQYDKLLARLKAKKSYQDADFGNDTEYYYTKEEHAAILSLLEEKAGEDWVSVESGLPKNNTTALFNDRVVFLQSNGIIRIGCYDYEFGDWIDDSGAVYKDVTHWKPLPQPPKTK